jgi:hypothetical protein
MEEFVVVRKVPGTENDFEPVHPGHTSEAEAKRLKAALNAAGMPCAVWTHDRWNREDARIRAEVFCEQCGEEYEHCKCPKRDGEYHILAEDAYGH